MPFIDLSPALIRLICEAIPTPSDVYANILDKKRERSALHALSLTSKWLNPEATRLLYATMTDLEGGIHLKFLGTIEKKPRLAAHVRRYSTPRQLIPEPKGRLWGRLKRSLLLMTKLKELSVSSVIGGHPTDIFPLASEDGSMPFQLHTFKFDISSPTSKFRDQALEFLITQNELKHLTWVPNTNISPAYLQKISCNLSRLEGSVGAIHSILPGREIKALSWSVSNLFKGNEFKTPTDRTRTKNVLKMPEFRAITELLLPDSNSYLLLEILDQMKLDPLNNLETLMDRSFGSEYSAVSVLKLSQLFPQLKTLILRHPESYLPAEGHEEKIHEVFDVFLNIQRIYEFDTHWHNFGENQYKCWTRRADNTITPEFLRLRDGVGMVPYLHFY